MRNEGIQCQNVILFATCKEGLLREILYEYICLGGKNVLVTHVNFVSIVLVMNVSQKADHLMQRNGIACEFVTETHNYS